MFFQYTFALLHNKVMKSLAYIVNISLTRRCWQISYRWRETVGQSYWRMVVQVFIHTSLCNVGNKSREGAFHVLWDSLLLWFPFSLLRGEQGGEEGRRREHHPLILVKGWSDSMNTPPFNSWLFAFLRWTSGKWRMRQKGLKAQKADNTSFSAAVTWLHKQ